MSTKIASQESAPPWAFSYLSIWEMLKCSKADKIARSLSRYLAIVRSWSSYSPIAWLAISYESLNTHRPFIPSYLVIFSLTHKTSYLVLLLVALNEKWSIYSVTTLFDLMRIRPTPFPWKFDAPSTCRIQVISGESYLVGHSSGVSSEHVHSTRKSAKIWTFKDDLGW